MIVSGSLSQHEGPIGNGAIRPGREILHTRLPLWLRSGCFMLGTMMENGAGWSGLRWRRKLTSARANGITTSAAASRATVRESKAFRRDRARAGELYAKACEKGDQDSCGPRNGSRNSYGDACPPQGSTEPDRRRTATCGSATAQRESRLDHGCANVTLNAFRPRRCREFCAARSLSEAKDAMQSVAIS